MKKLYALAGAATLALSLAAPAANAQQREQWITTADGCTYSKTQAPGYPAQWVLVRNPTHLGLPPGGRHCKNML